MSFFIATFVAYCTAKQNYEYPAFTIESGIF